MKKSLKSILLLLMLYVVSFTNKVYALSFNENVDINKKCSLTLNYKIDNMSFENIEIKLYKIASITEKYEFVVGDYFSQYSSDIHNVKSQKGWNRIQDTIENLIITDNIAYNMTNNTDETGMVRFDNLVCGLYFISGVEKTTEDKIYSFKPLLISIPNINKNNVLNYHVETIPKYSVQEKQKNKFTVVVQWEDKGFRSIRPKSVFIDIYRDGELFNILELTEDNNWTSTWEMDDYHKWNAKERSLDNDYKVTYDIETNLIIITNAITGETPEDDNKEINPKTGDDIYNYLILGAISGIGLIFSSLIMRKENKNNAK